MQNKESCDIKLAGSVTAGGSLWLSESRQNQPKKESNGATEERREKAEGNNQDLVFPAY